MMPKMKGFEVSRRLDNKENLGIVMLTARNDSADKVLGLELGADDYVKKPFDIKVDRISGKAKEIYYNE